jgi:hypothetical protein
MVFTNNTKMIIYIKFYYWFLILCFACSNICFADKEAELLLEAFLGDLNKNLSAIDQRNYFSHNFSKWETFKKLVAADQCVVVPLLLDAELQYVSNSEWDFVHSHAIMLVVTDICKFNGLRHHNPWYAEPFDTTWYGGYEHAKERFELLYNILLKARINDNKQKIEMINDVFCCQGIFILTFLMEKITEGDDLLLPIVQKMFDEYGDEIKGKSKDEILAWWQQNKIKYRLPPQDKKKFRDVAPLLFYAKIEYTMEEKVNLLYHDRSGWEEIHIVQGTAPTARKESKKSIELAQLIGYENTPQFRFLVDLGKDALPYLFLKLRDEKERFTLPVIEKIVGKKLSPETVEACIEASEKIVAKQKKPDTNQEPTNNQNQQSKTERPKIEHPKIEPPKTEDPKIEHSQTNKPVATNIDPSTNTASTKETQPKTEVASTNLSMRPWESKDGIFRTHARFVALINDQVVLERYKDIDTGKTIKVDLNILRQVDIDTVKAIRKRYRELKSEGKPLPEGMIFDPL